MLIKSPSAPNPLKGWQLDPSQVGAIGKELQRPECILAERGGTIWCADARGGVICISPDGSQRLITQTVSKHFDMAQDPTRSLLTGTLPNGLAFAKNGDLLISNFGTDRLERMTRTGVTTILADKIDGMPMGKVNFVLRDRRDRVWITVSTRQNPWNDALRPSLTDGYIALMDNKGLRIVAEGFAFTNEIRLDAAEEWIYVAETAKRRVTRLRVEEDGALTNREVYGPSSLGTGFIDGIAFDAFGNLWATMIFADRLIAITPEGDALELLNDGDPVATERLEAEVADGSAPRFETLMATGGRLCRWLASVTFGGEDLRTVYLGGLRSTTIPFFKSPVAGLPMAHW